MKGKKILVTGGAGYIGSHTVLALKNAGFRPIIVDNFSNSEKWILKQLEELLEESVIYHEIDCCDKDSFRALFEKEKNIEGVIHFAAFKAVGESVQNPSKYYQNNIGSLSYLINLMQEFKVPNLVFSSSCTVYGEADSLPVTE